MSRGARRWYLLHKWSSLVCTAFLLVLCVTGLPLVFRDEIEDWLRHDLPARAATEGISDASLDAMVESARGPAGLYPGESVRWISIEDDKPEVWIALAPSYAADRKLNHVVKFEAHSGRVMKAMPAAAKARPTFMGIVLHLHKDLLSGLVGELLLAAMGVLLVLATVSGIILYGPFMRKLDFGAVRGERGARLAWLDRHNLLGIVTAAWVLVVGATGVMNEISDPLYEHWRTSTLAAMQRPYEGQAMPTELASVQAAVDTVARALPGMKIRSARFPDGELGSPHHYLIWAFGNSPLTSRLFQPALVDARTGQLTMIGELPWYLIALQLSRPLHFGDYGGLPLKIMWALLDVITIVVLCSGLYLWWARRGSVRLRHRAMARVVE